jgi:hypothetical protein
MNYKLPHDKKSTKLTVDALISYLTPNKTIHNLVTLPFRIVISFLNFHNKIYHYNFFPKNHYYYMHEKLVATFGYPKKRSRKAMIISKLLFLYIRAFLCYWPLGVQCTQFLEKNCSLIEWVYTQVDNQWEFVTFFMITQHW